MENGNEKQAMDKQMVSMNQIHEWLGEMYLQIKLMQEQIRQSNQRVIQVKKD
jgi:hypothetical protein